MIMSDSRYLTNKQYAMSLKLIGHNKQGLDEAFVSANMAGISCDSFLNSNFHKWVVELGATQHMIKL